MFRGELKHKGFTLIEIMICIAIVAIVMAISVSALKSFGATSRHQDYRQALDGAEFNLERLRGEDFSNLPPQQLVVKGGSVTLAQEDLVPGSVRVLDNFGIELPFIKTDYENRTVKLGPQFEGKKVLVHYEFSLPHGNSAHFVDEDGKVVLPGGVNTRVHNAFVAEGEKLQATTQYELTENTLQFPPELAGQLVVVDYESDTRYLKVKGEFLDQSLKPTDKPSQTKLMLVQEPFPGGWRVTLPLLKEAP